MFILWTIFFVLLSAWSSVAGIAIAIKYLLKNNWNPLNDPIGEFISLLPGWIWILPIVALSYTIRFIHRHTKKVN